MPEDDEELDYSWTKNPQEMTPKQLFNHLKLSMEGHRAYMRLSARLFQAIETYLGEWAAVVTFQVPLQLQDLHEAFTEARDDDPYEAVVHNAIPGDWQPISTAPEDGTRMWLFHEIRVKGVLQDEYVYGYVDNDGVVKYVNTDEEVGWELSDFTHWMLPPRRPISLNTTL